MTQPTRRKPSPPHWTDHPDFGVWAVLLSVILCLILFAAGVGRAQTLNVLPESCVVIWEPVQPLPFGTDTEIASYRVETRRGTVGEFQEVTSTLGAANAMTCAKAGLVYHPEDGGFSLWDIRLRARDRAGRTSEPSDVARAGITRSLIPNRPNAPHLRVHANSSTNLEIVISVRGTGDE